MEDDLGIPSALFAPPIRDNIVEMGKSQVGFMSVFALPLFQGVSQIMPAMRFSVDEMHINKSIWETKIEEGQEAERSSTTALPDPTSQPDSFRLTGNNSTIPPMPLPSELHPPEIKTSSGQISPLTSRTPTKEFPDGSRRSSFGAVIHPSSTTPSSKNHTNTTLAPENTTTQSRRSSTNTTLLNGQSLPTDHSSTSASDRSASSSGAFSSAHTPAHLNRRSSNTAPSQLQLGLAPDTPHTKGGAVASNTTTTRRRSADHSLVAVLVTSSGQTTTSKTSADSAPTHQPPTNHHHPTLPRHDTRRHSSGKSSLPSSPEWASQVTSPANDDTPTTPGTSFRSTQSSTEPRTEPGKSASVSSPTVTDFADDDAADHRYDAAAHAPPPPDRDAQPENYTSSSAASSMRDRGVRHKTSRWKLKFWAAKKKIPTE